MSGENIIEVEHLDAGYPGVKVLEDVNFTVAKGEVFARLAARLPRRRADDCPAASELGILRRTSLTLTVDDHAAATAGT